MLYIRNLLITAFTIFSLVGITNWLVDPFGMYWSPTLNGINEIKPEAGNRSRIIKAYRAIEVSPDILIVGNSRVEMGLNPDLPHFATSTVYNQGMPGAKLHMQIDYAKDLINQTPHIKEVIMSIDFLDFLIGPDELANQRIIDEIPQEYDEHILSKNSSTTAYVAAQLATYYKLLFSLDALQASVITLINQNDLSSTITPKGFNTANSYKKIIKYEGYEPLFGQKLDWLQNRLSSRQWILFPDPGSFHSPKFAQLHSLITLCKEKDISFKIFINPYHFSYLHALKQAGYWEKFLQWKYALVEFFKQEQLSHISLWDFSLINARTTEKIGEKEDLQWFWEPAHYKRSYGDTIIELLAGNKASTDYGVILNEKNINVLVERQDEKLKNTIEQWGQLRERLKLSKTL